MQMKKGHYQQKDLDQEVISVGKEEGNSMQGMEDPLENSLETPCYFQEDQWSKQPKYIKKKIRNNISNDQDRFGLIWEDGENTLKW